MIVGEPLKSRIERFLQNFSERYEKCEKVPKEKSDYVEQHYIPQIVRLDNNTRNEIIQILEDSWNKNQDHGNLYKWCGAARGVAEYLLMPIEMDQVQIDMAVDVVVRISRWYHTNKKCGLWKRFVPYASNVVKLVWGDIEKL
jgi:DNA polymerase II small subunit/DNA polymerase delta subunit B